MFTGLTYIFTSITLSILLPYLLKGDGHYEDGDTLIYRYPRRVSKFILLFLPAASAVGGIIIYHHGEPKDFGLTGSILAAIILVAGPTIAYLYINTYRLILDSAALVSRTIFGKKVINLQEVAKLATVHTKGTELTLYNANNVILIKIDGSIDDFDSLKCGIEARTRLPNVMLYSYDAINGWQERPNEIHIHWQPSKGPIYRNPVKSRNILVFTVVGLIALAHYLPQIIWMIINKWH